MVNLIPRALWVNPYQVGVAGYRYWRIYINYTGQAAAIIAEMEWRSTPGGADQTGSGTASASGTNAGSPAAVVDNNNSTAWVSNVDMLSVPGTPAIWTYDFGVGVVKDIQEITIRADANVGNGNYAPNAFHIQRSVDGSTWVTVWGVRSITNWTDAETRTFTRPVDYATTPQYGNTSSIGDRTGPITVTTTASMSGSITALVNGNNTSDELYWSVTSSPVEIKFAFGVGVSKVIDGFTFYQSNGAINHGTWQMAGSNDDSSYTTFPESFLLGDNTNQQSVQTLTNTTGYRYYKLTKIAGSTSASGFIYEFDFKIKDAGAAMLWTPIALGSNLLAWFKGDTNTGSNGALIQTWTDQSSNNKNLTQVTSGLRPTLDTTGLNGMNVVDFDAATIQWFDLPLSTFTGATSASVYLVIKIDNDPPGSTPKTGLWRTGHAANMTHFPFTDGNVYQDFTRSTVVNTGNPTASLASWRIVGMHSVTNDWAMFVDGVSHFSTATSTFSVSLGSISVGRSDDGAGNFVYLDGKIAEIYFTKAKQSSTEREKCEGYLAHRWGLTGNLAGGHPYKSTPPTV